MRAFSRDTRVTLRRSSPAISFALSAITRSSS